MNFTYVSNSLPLVDGADKAAGRILYTGDMALDGMLHTKLLLSPRAHARIESINTARAMAEPGVVAVFTHENTPPFLYNSALWAEDQEFVEDERLFPPVVRFIGDRVAAVVAETAEIATRAVEFIDIIYQDLPPVFDPAEALAAPAEPGFESPIIEVAVEYGDTDDGFAEADLIVEDHVRTPKTHHSAMENHVCIALPEAGGITKILTPCQNVFAALFVTAKALGVSKEELRVVKTPVGGSFGGKSEPILEPLCAHFAKITGRPVIIELDRRESIIATRSRSRVFGTVRTAVNREGRILARDLNCINDAGAYATGSPLLAASMSRRAFRLYDIASQRYRCRAVYTNTPVSGAFRGYGSPQIHSITEINLDHVARRLDIDPVAFRLKNLIQPHADDPLGGPSVGNARIIDCVRQGARAFGWEKRRHRQTATDRVKRGVGMACGNHTNGNFGAFPEFSTQTLRLEESNQLVLNGPLHDLGCGAVTTISQIVAEVMQIAPDRIRVTEGDTATQEYDQGTRASRVTPIFGECARRVAEKLRGRVLDEAALAMNCAASDLIMADGLIKPKYGPQRQLSYGEVARLFKQQNGADLAETETFHATANPGSYAAHFVAVEVDTLTGRVKVLEVLAAHDIGQPLNRQLVEGQVHGGIQMGMGLALLEDLDIDASGATKGDSFARYHQVNASDMPPVEVLLIDEIEDSGPFGAKALGEIAAVPTAPAIVNAVNHALGTSLCDLPLTPERVVAAVLEAAPPGGA